MEGTYNNIASLAEFEVLPDFSIIVICIPNTFPSIVYPGDSLLYQ